MTGQPNAGLPSGTPVLGRPGEPPPAPGRLGSPVAAGDARIYLEGLTGWRDRVRATLGELDARTRQTRARRDPGDAARAARVASDVTLAFAMWQAVADRTDQMVRLYDNGRMGRVEAEQMSVLIWGRLDGTPVGGGLPISFVEACTLASSFTATLAAEVAAADLVGAAQRRVDDMHVRLAAAQRQAGAPGTRDRAHALALSLADLAARAAAGSDVGAEIDALDGALGLLEADLAAAQAHAAIVTSIAEALPGRLRGAAGRAAEVQALAARCGEKIARPPRLGIPDPLALGPPPAVTDRPGPDQEAAVHAFDDRLTRLEAALVEARARYQAPLDERNDLRGLLQSYQAKAAALHVAEDPRLIAAYEAARRVLWSAPCDLVEARTLATAYAALVPGGAGPVAAPTDDVSVGERGRGAHDTPSGNDDARTEER